MLRLGIFLSVFALMISIENVLPSRATPIHRWRSCIDNALLTLIASIAMRLTPALLAFNIAIYAQTNSIGLLNNISIFTNSPELVLLISIVFLDFAIYCQHRLFHSIPILWRLHRVHHSDNHLDASSALRFHPLEIVMSMIIKSTLAISLGISPAAIVLFEIILNASALFNHSNFDIRRNTDSMLQKLIVTPTMHRIHHSELKSDSDKNFGFCLSIWDQLFGTYAKKSASSMPNYKLGVRHMQPSKAKGLVKLLEQPWQDPSSLESGKSIHDELNR